jgi:O-antigen/teichoic acid export membrane protein
MGAALIQKKGDTYVESLYNTAFWSGLIWSVMLFLILCFIVGPFTASFYNEPLLTKIIPVLSFGILIKPLSLIPTTILTRAMDFRMLALINNSATIVAGLIGLLIAILGFGVWALVISNVLMAVLNIPMLFVITRWVPKFEWIKNYFNDLFGFGIYSTGTSIISTTSYNIDNLMIGKLLGSASLGAYTLAFSFTELIRQTISSILNKVMFPVFGRFQDNKAKAKDYFLKIIKLNAILIYPLMLFLIIFANELILNFFGNKWSDAILPMRFLAVAVIIHLTINSFATFLRGLGYPRLELKIIIITTIFVLIPGLYWGITKWGLLGATLAIIINKTSLVVIALWVMKKNLKIKLIEILTFIKGPVFAIIIVSVLTVVLKVCLHNTSWIILSVFYFLSYLILITIFEKKTILMIKEKMYFS